MLDRPLSEVSLVFLDTETTGLYPRSGDRVVEIALARFRGGAMENYFHSKVNPQGRLISAEAARVNGFTDAELMDAPVFAEIAPRVCAELDGAAIVMHNAPFDLGFVANEFRLAGQVCPDNPVLDTLALLRGYFSFPSNSLRRVAAALGIQTQPTHRALEDALTTRGVFEYVVQRLGIRTLGDWLRLQGGAIPWEEVNAAVSLSPDWQEALRLRRRLFLRYVDNFGEQTERWVSPLGVRADREYVYLRAFCHLRGAEREFRLDRVLEMKVEE